jgi:regulator of replication initiation timing
MTEQDLKNMISVYQQKSFELFNQVIALESKLTNSNQLLEALTNKVKELAEENDKLKNKQKRTAKNSAEETF